MQQGLLPFASPARCTAAMAAELEALLGVPVQVTFGRSQRTPVQVQRHPARGFEVRMHRFFARAPASVLDALARWIRSGRRARRASADLDAWIDAELQHLAPRTLGPLRPRGAVYDLGRLLPDVLRDHVPELLDAPPPVTWGRRARSRSVRALQLGSFAPDTRLIRIHPVLDHASVPEFFVRFVLFHELLHAAMPPDEQLQHSPGFRARERTHPDYELAHRFEAEAIETLIERARSRTMAGP